MGGGFIGLETAENLHACGIEVTIVQHSTHVMPNFDREMAYFIHSELAMSGIDVLLNSEVTGFTSTGEAVTVNLKDGAGLSADLVIISAGVKPNSELAGDAGLLLGARGHIQVNKFLQTSDENIYAAPFKLVCYNLSHKQFLVFWQKCGLDADICIFSVQGSYLYAYFSGFKHSFGFPVSGH